ncbi:MAG: hypothetical protein IKO93_03070 [Lentisphaeria bacterium]|nr:hypothetical protein [Lentisphaeria bacterium]MBR6859852.1 hypothetical protein [Acidaminococcaceae bacterium]
MIEDLARRHRDLLIRYTELLMKYEQLKHKLEILNALGISIKAEREETENADK